MASWSLLPSVVFFPTPFQRSSLLRNGHSPRETTYCPCYEDCNLAPVAKCVLSIDTRSPPVYSCACDWSCFNFLDPADILLNKLRHVDSFLLKVFLNCFINAFFDKLQVLFLQNFVSALRILTWIVSDECYDHIFNKVIFAKYSQARYLSIF